MKKPPCLNRYTRVPWTVITDPVLSSYAVRVYGILAGHVWEGTTVKVGTRNLARFASMSRNSAMAALGELKERGHIEVIPDSKGRRSMYCLTSPVFGQKQGAEDVVQVRDGRKRLVSIKAS